MNTHMTRNLTGALRSATADAAAVVRREAYVDVFRGLLIAHMALDHASLMFNAGRAAEELAAGAAPAFGDLLQFLTRFTGVPVAPAFFFMAGFMVAMTSTARAAAASRKRTSRGDSSSGGSYSSRPMRSSWVCRVR